MIGKDEVSRELQNAFVDDELDQADWERVAERLGTDEALRADICALRQTKQLVRRAYGQVLEARPGSKRRTRWMAAAALCVVSATAGWIGHAQIWEDSDYSDARVIASVRGLRNVQEDKIVVHVNSSRVDVMATALEEVEDALRAAQAGHRAFEVEIVANSTGLNLLRADVSPFASKLAALRARYPNLIVVACRQSMNRLRSEGIRVKLLPGVEVAPSALEEILKRVREGWAYVRA